ncbi:12313_t:CDS:2 [Acaulospora morrowiae]|uniref:12313_t:CDS:1 n=1 Tax=Acaulospora morrowiae TaxID=94023 RepID=A0A9N8ZG84_9GLOM|nr:12313_t:CDS:2 [Acaulospora morrowiae]
MLSCQEIKESLSPSESKRKTIRERSINGKMKKKVNALSENMNKLSKLTAKMQDLGALK